MGIVLLSSQMDAEKLEVLVQMAGGTELLIASEARGARIRAEIVRALCHPTDV